jgi:MOB kinase activator 1
MGVCASADNAEPSAGAQPSNSGHPAELKADSATNANTSEAYSFWDRNKTFKPAVGVPKGKEKLQATMKATLGGGELKKSVKLPEGEDLNEWIAVNTIHFFNAANMIYGTCADFCTEETCPIMSAGRNEYLWKDGVNYKKPTKVNAPLYIDLLLNWINDQISNPNLFPTDENARFPRNFMSQVKVIFKRLFRLYAHIYYSHFESIRSIGANAHLNTCFKHFIFFVLEFNLCEKKDLMPLDSFIQKFREED